MKLYYSNLGCANFTEEELPKLGVLDSYANCKKPKVYPWADAYFMDSGAFSVWKSGKTISLADYIAFCKEHESLFEVIASLDVIGSADGTYRNYMKMREAGLNPLPCFHKKEPFTYLDMYAKETSYIGLGGMAIVHADDRHSFFREVFARYPDPKVVGFHGFGVNDPELLTPYPWKSCDAASIYRQATMGGIRLPVGSWVKICGFDRSLSGRMASPGEVSVLKEWISSLGFSYEIAATWGREGLKERCKIGVAFYEALAKEVPERYTVTQRSFHL